MTLNDQVTKVDPSGNRIEFILFAISKKFGKFCGWLHIENTQGTPVNRLKFTLSIL
jgi:hypothetical protein